MVVLDFHFKGELDNFCVNLVVLAYLTYSDPQIYLEMQLLAGLKYGLLLDDIHFVGNSVAHNIDINEIVQDLHAFVENYSYNIYNQVFSSYCCLIFEWFRNDTYFMYYN